MTNPQTKNQLFVFKIKNFNHKDSCCRLQKNVRQLDHTNAKVIYYVIK